MRYDYDADGRVNHAATYADAEASDPKGVARFLNNDAGRLEDAEMDPDADGEVEVTSSYEYDATGRLIRHSSVGFERRPRVHTHYLEYRYDC